MSLYLSEDIKLNEVVVCSRGKSHRRDHEGGIPTIRGGVFRTPILDQQEPQSMITAVSDDLSGPDMTRYVLEWFRAHTDSAVAQAMAVL
nr:uncharacterized protein CTRU02_04213 [Colletotrichum truncatum]KAF6796252.1 hypothetical protein CTRU02_04213 [Colletotrichum truncatum]